MIGAGDCMVGKGFANQRAKATLHAVANDRIADLLRHGVTDTDKVVVIAALANEQDEAGRRRALAAVGGKEVGALR